MGHPSQKVRQRCDRTPIFPFSWIQLERKLSDFEACKDGSARENFSADMA